MRGGCSRLRFSSGYTVLRIFYISRTRLQEYGHFTKRMIWDNCLWEQQLRNVPTADSIDKDKLLLGLMKRKNEIRKRGTWKTRDGWQQEDQDREIARKQWHTWSIREKLQYLVSYYGIAMAVCIIAVCCAIFLITDIKKEKVQDAFFVMAVDAKLQEDEAASMQEELAGLLGLDQKTQRCVIEAGYSGTANMQSEATVSAYLRSGRADLLIAPETDFNRYASAGYLAALTDTKLTDLYEMQDLFYAQQIDYSKGGAITEIPFHPHEATASSACYGIYIRNGQFRGYVIGVMANCPHKNYIQDSLAYFLGLPKE